MDYHSYPDSIYGIVYRYSLSTVKASRRYKTEKVDAEKAELFAEIERLKEMNKRLTKRNLELGDKLSSLTR